MRVCRFASYDPTAEYDRIMQDAPQLRQPLALWLALLALAILVAAGWAAARSFTLLALALAIGSGIISTFRELIDRGEQRRERMVLQTVAAVAVVIGIVAWSEDADLLAYLMVFTVIGVTFVDMKRRPWPKTDH